MKIKKSTILLFLLIFTSMLFSGEKVKKIKEKDLPQKHRNFLKLTRYIMLTKEKEPFMQLTTDRERDIFIDAFWKQRDPTSGTPRNEYKEEHIKRFNYVSKFFKRGTPREGWMTDMGRFYIVLGPPVSKERFYGTLGVYPTEVWSYYGDPEKGLPSHFVLVFFQRGGVGEFKLYDPVSDSPTALMVHSKGFAMENYESMYDRLMELAPTLATVSLSLIPGEIPYNYTPSARNAILIADIIESPKKDINPSYATHFLSYKGIVSTEYMTNLVESEVYTALFPDPVLGINFLHFSLAPKTISIDYYEPDDKYFCNFTLNVSLKYIDDVIFQYTREFPLYFAPADLDKVRANGISIEDSFPVVDGEYQVTILLQNSVGKEFCILEKNISVQGKAETPQIIGPFLGYKFQDYQSSVHLPFKAVNKKLVVDPKNTYSNLDDISFFFNIVNVTRDLWNEGKVKIFVKTLRSESPVQKFFTLDLKNYPYHTILSIPHSIPAKEFSPDYYEINMVLIGQNGETVDEKKTTFIVSAEKAVPHPIARAKILPFSNNFLFYYMLAHQHGKVKDYEMAEANYEKAYNLNPDYKKGLIEYANFMFQIRKYDRSLELIENIKEDLNLKFDYYLTKGRAYMGMGQYPEAINSLVEGNKIYNSDTGLLNSLGLCYYRVGEKEKALGVFKSSLSLNSEQEEVKRLIEEIEKGLG